MLLLAQTQQIRHLCVAGAKSPARFDSRNQGARRAYAPHCRARFLWSGDAGRLRACRFLERSVNPYLPGHQIDSCCSGFVIKEPDDD